MNAPVSATRLIRGTLVAAAFAIGCALPTSCAARWNRPFDYHYPINGHSMHVTVEGAGQTVIFSSGSGEKDPYADFESVTSVLKTDFEVVVFSRAGFGGSEATDKPRDIDTVVTEMHELFAAAGLSAPFILVGHSIASLEILGFAQKYPDAVCGIFLIEGTPPRILPDVLADEMIEGLARDVRRGFAPKATLDESIWWRPNAAAIVDAGALTDIHGAYICRQGMEDAGWLREFVASAQIIEVNGDSHRVHHTHPELVVDTIRGLACEDSPGLSP